MNKGIPDLIELSPICHEDERGIFAETYHLKKYSQLGIGIEFVQDNHSLSFSSGTVRGMHFQEPPVAQGKLVRCGQGAIYDVALDIRRGSPTYGVWAGFHLSAENRRQLYLPVGFAHGFMTLEANSEIIYKCTDFYSPDREGTLRWDSCGIDWPSPCDPVLSDKDRQAIAMSDFESPFFYGENS
jgi:dTDP-4-dehydrorhamnose 3,5-epimerase